MHEAVDPGTYLVECYWPGVDEQKLDAALGRTREVVDELRRRGHDLRFRGSILVAADETVFWLYDGAAADVRAVAEHAGVAVERVLESRWIEGGQAGDRTSKRGVP